MGRGFSLCCDRCGWTKSAHLGVGFFFPGVYARTMETARAGKLGKRIRQFLDGHPDGALNAENVLLLCENCGNLEYGQDLSMYVRNPDVARGEQGRWSAAVPYEGADYVSPMELKRENTYVYYGPGHLCRKCGKPMRSISEEDLTEQMSGDPGHMDRTEIPCPKCGEPLRVDGPTILWD